VTQHHGLGVSPHRASKLFTEQAGYHDQGEDVLRSGISTLQHPSDTSTSAVDIARWAVLSAQLPLRCAIVAVLDDSGPCPLCVLRAVRVIP
jgi:hypothetical protein